MTEVLYDEIRELIKENSKLKEERNILVAELQNGKKNDSGCFGANWRVIGWNEALDWVLASLGMKEKQKP